MEYQRLAQTTRLAPREDRLGSRPPPPDEMPLSATARQKADIEKAMQRQPFERMQITFMVLSLGGTNWRDLRERYKDARGKAVTRDITWRERVGEWWGITAGDVAKIADETVEAMHADLNRIATGRVV